MLIIAVANAKGGVGKSTIATSLCVAITMQNKKVTFIDLDPQLTAKNYLQTLDNDKYKPFHIQTDISIEPPAETEVVIIDYPPTINQPIPKGAVIIAPTKASAFDLHSYRRVIEFEKLGHTVIRVINEFSQVRKMDKELLESMPNSVPISANSAIPNAIADKRSIWNTHLPGGKKAKMQFNYLIKCIKNRNVPAITIEQVNAISARGDI